MTPYKNTGISGSSKVKQAESVAYVLDLFYNMTKERLSLLVRNGLIEYQEGQRTFKIIEKGYIFYKFITIFIN